MKSGVYKITNTVNGKVYIGSAVNLVKRTNDHKHHLRKGKHHSAKLQNAWNKYGESAFIFETLLLCSAENLLMYEQHCIDGFNSVVSGYNICPTAGNTTGVKCSDETRKKQAAAKIGRVGNNLGNAHTEETRARISAALRGNNHSRGRKASEETKAKLRVASTGNSRRLGKFVSAETKEKLRKAALGNTNWLGKRHTAESNEKNRLSHLKKNQLRRELKAQLLAEQSLASSD